MMNKMEIAEFLENSKFSNDLVKEEVQSFSNIHTTKVEWLWYPYLPKGKIVILQGDPGDGKTHVSIEFSSIVSNGNLFPFSDNKVNVGKVILQNGEDGKNDTLKPRLEKANANCENVYIIDEDETIFTINQLERFESIIKVYNPTLIVIDPIQRYIGDIDMNSANQVRTALAPLGKLAEKYDVTMLLVMHLNKGQTKALYKTLGSIDMVGIARSILTVGRTIDTKERILCHTKSNLGPLGKSIVYEIGDKGITWLEERENIDVDDIVSIPEKKPRQKAKEYLIDKLSKGAIPSKTLQQDAVKIGIPKATLDRAKKELNLESFQKDKQWYVKRKDS